jgi:hypothetical protein
MVVSQCTVLRVTGVAVWLLAWVARLGLAVFSVLVDMMVSLSYFEDTVGLFRGESWHVIRFLP